MTDISPALRERLIALGQAPPAPSLPARGKGGPSAEAGASRP